MRAKITKFFTFLDRNFNLGDYHGVKIGVSATVELLPDNKTTQVTFDGQEAETPGFVVEMDEGETLQSLTGKVQGMMREAIQEASADYMPYVVPFVKKRNVPVRVTETYQGSPVEREIE